MMSLRQLTTFERPLRARRVLSVYLAGVDGDPGVRDRWRIRLKGALAAVEKELAAASHAEREAFASAARAIANEARLVPAAARGWLAFATADGLLRAEISPVEMPTLAVWQDGAFLAPYLRLTALVEPVLVAILDRKKARLFRQTGDALALVDTMTPAPHPGPEPRARGPRPGKTHSGTRGETGADEFSRVKLTEREDLVRQLALSVVAHAAKDEPVLVGGTPEMVKAALAALHPLLGARLVHDPVLTHAATPARITAAAHAVAPRRFLLAHPGLLDEIAERAGADGRAALSASGAIGALREGRARELLLSRRWAEAHPASADLAIKTAADQRATVVELDGVGGDRLHALGGVAARLRYGRAARAASARVTSGTQD